MVMNPTMNSSIPKTGDGGIRRDGLKNAGSNFT